MSFAESMKEVRQAAGRTQQALSDATGIPKRTIEDWEYGKRVPPEWVQRLVLEKVASLAE